MNSDPMDWESCFREVEKQRDALQLELARIRGEIDHHVRQRVAEIERAFELEAERDALRAALDQRPPVIAVDEGCLLAKAVAERDALREELLEAQQRIDGYSHACAECEAREDKLRERLEAADGVIAVVDYQGVAKGCPAIADALVGYRERFGSST